MEQIDFPVYQVLPRQSSGFDKHEKFEIGFAGSSHILTLNVTKYNVDYRLYDSKSRLIDSGAFEPDIPIRDEIFLMLREHGLENAPIRRFPSKETPARRVFVDMDGTLAEFRPDSTMRDLESPGYFRSLKPQETMVDAVKALAVQPGVDVYILSSALETPTARPEKEAWLDQYLPEIDAQHRLFPLHGTDKARAVPQGLRKGDILLDDYSRNLHDWTIAGGIGIKFMNGINGRHGSWQYSADPREMAMVDILQPANIIGRMILTIGDLHEQLIRSLSAAELNTLYLYGHTAGISDKLEVSSGNSSKLCGFACQLLQSAGFFPTDIATDRGGLAGGLPYISFRQFDGREQYLSMTDPAGRARCQKAMLANATLAQRLRGAAQQAEQMVVTASPPSRSNKKVL